MAATWEAGGGLRVSRTVVVPSGELRWRFSRSGGPGGQSVNTTDSRVELTVDVARSTAFGTTFASGSCSDWPGGWSTAS